MDEVAGIVTDETWDDDRLMARVSEGEEAAYRLLVSRWQEPVFGFLVHMVSSREDAEDLAQETFLRVFTQAGRYRPEGKFKSWILRIAGNLARSWLRRRQVLRWVRFEPALHDRLAAGDGPERDLEQAEISAVVREAVRKLPWRQRQAVVLKRYQGLSYQEIASALEATVPAVESLLQRAAATLKRELSGKVDLS